MMFGVNQAGNSLQLFGGELRGVTQQINAYKNAIIKVNPKTGENNLAKLPQKYAGANIQLREYFENTERAKVSTGGYAKYLLRTKMETIGLTIASTALNMAISAGVAALVGLAIKGFDALITTSAEAKENLEQVTSELEGLEASATSTQEELEKVKNRISEINQLKQSGVVSAELEAELQDLGLQTAELEKQLWLYQQQAKIKANDKKDAQGEVWNSANSSVFSVWDNFYDPNSGEEANMFVKIANLFSGSASVLTNEANSVEPLIDGYNKLIKQRDELLKDGSATPDELEAINDQIATFESSLIAISATMLAAGDNGEAAFLKIQMAMLTPEEKLRMLKEEFMKLSGSETITGEKLSELYAKAEDGDAIKVIIDALVSLGVISGTTATDLDAVGAEIEAIGTKSDDAANAVKGLTDEFKKLDSVSSGLKTLSTAYSEKMDNGVPSYDTLSDIQTNFAATDGRYGIDLSSYIQELADAETSVERYKQILGELAEANIRVSLTDTEIVDSGEDVIAAMLKQNGVANANAEAKRIVTEAAARLAIQEDITSGKLDTSKKGLEANAAACGLTANAYINLVAQEVIWGNNELSIEDKVKKLQTLAEAIGLTADEYANLGAYNYYAVPDGAGGTVQIPYPRSQSELDSTWEELLKKAGANTTNTYNGTTTGAGGATETWLDKYNKQIELELARLDSLRGKGLITEQEYWTEVEKLYADGYNTLINSSEAYEMDEKERLDTENALREKYHSAHVSAYENEVKELEHARAMNIITEEQYYAKLTALYNKYYAGQDEYNKEAMAVEEELYDKRVELVEKWSDAAIQAVEAVGDATEGLVSAMTEFIEGAIDTHEENFNLEKSLLQHSLDMNYITEEQYYQDLEKLYKKYFASKYIYMEQYWENQEEIYAFEQQQLEDGASAVEDIHAAVVDMIKAEKEDAIDSIEETRDKYLELIDIRRKALQDLKDEEDYEKNRNEKLASITELERQLNALSYDTSAAGVRKYKEVFAQLQEAREALSDLERERAYEMMDKELTSEQDRVDSTADSQVNSLNEELKDNEALVAEAWERMNGMNATLYQQLIEYNKQHSTSIKDEITGSWEEATRALGDYGDAYNAMLAYNNINNMIGNSGMSDSEYNSDATRIQAKATLGWVETSSSFLVSLVKVGADFTSTFAGIIGALTGNPYIAILANGVSALAGLASGGASIIGSITALLGGFASGTDYVPKTGIYQTDELGEELKLRKGTSGNYTLLTEGSKVFNAAQTDRLMRVINNPELLMKTASIPLSQDLISGIAGASYIDKSTQSVVVSPVFQINSDNPKGVASEIEKLFPKIANYTISKLTNKTINSGFRPSVKGMA